MQHHTLLTWGQTNWRRVKKIIIKVTVIEGPLLHIVYISRNSMQKCHQVTSKGNLQSSFKQKHLSTSGKEYVEIKKAGKEHWLELDFNYYFSL